MASDVVTSEQAPVYVVYRIDALGNDLYRVWVQMPDGSSTVILVPGVGTTLDSVRLAASVVGQLWTMRRGATPAAIG